MAQPTLVAWLGASAVVSDDASNTLTIDLAELDARLTEDNVTSEGLMAALLAKYVPVQNADADSELTIVADPFQAATLDGEPYYRYRFTTDVFMPGVFNPAAI